MGNVNQPELNCYLLIGPKSSGSGMLQCVLNSHPDIACAGEFFHYTYLQTVRMPVWRRPLHLRYWRRVGGHRHLPDDEGFLREIGVRTPSRWEFTFFPRWRLRRLFRMTLEALTACTGKRIAILRSPVYSQFVDERVWPESSVGLVVIYRCPEGALRARHHFQGNPEVWCAVVEKLIHHLEETTRRVFMLRYEDYIDDPDDWNKELCCFLGVPYCEEMRDYRAFPQFMPGGDSLGGGRRALAFDGIERRERRSAHEEFSEEELRHIRKVCDPVYARLDTLNRR